MTRSRIFGVVNGTVEHGEPAEGSVSEGEPTDSSFGFVGSSSKALENPGMRVPYGPPSALLSSLRAGGVVGFEKDKKHFIYDSETNQIGDEPFQTPTAIPEQRICVGYF